MLIDPSDEPTGLIGSESTCSRTLICLLMSRSGVGHYGDNQVNTEPVQAVGSWVGLSTRTALDEQFVYRIIMAIFESIDDIHADASFMKFITKDTALMQLNAPSHKGAIRHDREIGMALDPALIPPEGK
jgi:TRAP-type uncharacterized transport system substrate-binding protein